MQLPEPGSGRSAGSARRRRLPLLDGPAVFAFWGSCNQPECHTRGMLQAGSIASPRAIEVGVSLVAVLVLLGIALALVRESRLGGNVPAWLVAFLLGGPVTLAVYGATQMSGPKRDR